MEPGTEARSTMEPGTEVRFTMKPGKKQEAVFSQNTR